MAWLYTMPFVLPALTAYFSGDDFMNLHYHRFQREPWEAAYNTIAFWTTYRRPAGGLVYLALYDLFGISNPFPYYLTGLALFSVNICLTYWLLLRLSARVSVAMLGTAFAGIHPELADVYFNFGAVYELLACGFALAGFHAYLTARAATSNQARIGWLAAAVASYVVAIGGKEMAVTLPAVLLIFEIVYLPPQRPTGWIGRTIGALTPFFVIAAIASIGKTFGADALSVDNPAYAYHLDATIWNNLSLYLQKLLFNRVTVGLGGLLVALSCGLALARLFRSREMLFGLGMFLVTLTPVLGLPRNWGLFLYIPLIGLGLFAAALLAEIGRMVLARMVGSATALVRRRLAGTAASAVLAGMMALYLPSFARTRDVLFFEPGSQRRSALEQLFERYPSLPADAVVAIRNSPLQNYDMHFAIWLRYSPEIQVLAAVNFDDVAFRRIAENGHPGYALVYENGRLLTATGRVVR